MAAKASSTRSISPSGGALNEYFSVTWAGMAWRWVHVRSKRRAISSTSPQW
jgi:hypothetical protein